MDFHTLRNIKVGRAYASLFGWRVIIFKVLDTLLSYPSVLTDRLFQKNGLILFPKTLNYGIMDTRKNNKEIKTMKMRVLTATNKGKLLVIADQVAKKAESTYKVDSIPPDYSLDRERLLVIVATVKSSLSDSFRRFCSDLSKERASNVALIADGLPEDVAKLTAIIKEAGTNFIDDVLTITGGLPFKFAKKVTPEEFKAVDEWTDRILSGLK